MTNAFIFEFFLQFAIKASIILFISLTAAYLLRHHSATIRYLIWSATVYSILAIPVFYFILPAWNIGIIPKHISTAESISPIVPKITDTNSISSQSHLTELSWTENLYSMVQSMDWVLVLLVLWFSISIIIYSRLLLGLLSIWWMSKSAKSVDDKNWNLMVIELGNHLKLKRLVKILISPKASTPMTWGIFQPFVLLPDDAINWSEDRLKMVLTHELAHVKRKDFVTHLVTQLVSAMLWFNPLIWFVSKQLISDREHACDDYVLLDGVKGSEYASHLLDIARSLKENRQLTLASICMAKKSQLEGRLLSILDDNKTHQVNAGMKQSIILGLAILLVMPISILQPWSDQVTLSAQENKPIADRNDTSHSLIENINQKQHNKDEHAVVDNPSIKHGNSKKELFAVNKFHIPQNLAKKSADQLDIDDLIQLKITGVTKSFVKEMKSLFKQNLSVNELVMLKSIGVSKSFVKEMDDKLKRKLTIDEIIQLKSMGVGPDYILAMDNAFGKKISIDDIIQLKAMGVNPNYIDEMEDKYKNKLSISEIVSLKAMGASVEYMNMMNKAFKRDLPVNDIIQLKSMGINADYVKEMERVYQQKLTADKLVTLKSLGINADYVKKMHGIYGDKITIDNIVSLRSMGISPDYTREMRDYYGDRIDIDDIVQLKAMGISASFIKDTENAFKRKLKIDEIVTIKSMGVNHEYAKEMNNAFSREMSVDELVSLRSMGVNASYVKEMQKKLKRKLSVDKLIQMKALGISSNYLDGWDNIDSDNDNDNDNDN